MKTVAYYDTPFEAGVARAKLESEGIEAIVQNENTFGSIPLGGGIASLRPYVTVADEDITRAAGILEVAATPVHRDVCPECGSEKVESRLSWRGKPVNRMAYFWFLVILLGLMGHPGNIRRNCHCRRCGNWW